MNQLAFELDPPGYRIHDPITSKQAASQAVELQADHCALILACLKRHGRLGKDGIASRTRLDGAQCCRRLFELHRAKLIRCTGTVKSTAGRNEREWEAV
jgi:transcription initiation factor IIE alpha subunit